MNNSDLFDILVFAAIALFLIFKLGSVLGKKTGTDNDSSEKSSESGFGAYGKHFNDKVEEGQQKRAQKPKKKLEDDPLNIVNNIIPIVGKKAKSLKIEDAEIEPSQDDFSKFPKTVAEGLRKIAKNDADFGINDFIDGAGACFEIIVEAFAEGKRDRLKGLLDRQVMREFDAAITTREAKNLTLREVVIGIDAVTVVEVQTKGRYAYITVKIKSQQISALIDEDEQVIEGDEEIVRPRIDIWTFRRDTSSGDPNWVLSGTQSAH